MKNHTKKSIRASNGITLIALVVTIIVLLILAGVSIQMLTGDNGILQRTGEAKENTVSESEKEKISIAILGSYDETTLLNLDKLKSNLESNGMTVIGDNFPVTTTISGKKYTIESNGNVHEVNENIVTIAELQENASTYFGYDVINYAETLPIIDKGTENEKDYTKTKWQLFYAGPLDGERDGRIYLISKEYVKNILLPSKNGVTPIAVNTDYKAYFSTYKTNVESINDGILPQYTRGSNLITQEKLQILNNKYFEYLSKQNTSSTNPNMMAVAYMMDIDAGNSFATSTKGYAEYAIGGPTVELLFTAYNKYKNKTEQEKHLSDVFSIKGYYVRKYGDPYFSGRCFDMIENDVISETNQIDSPYSVSSLQSDASGYWLASPSSIASDGSGIATVAYDGGLYGPSYENKYYGFRPIILLNSAFQLEKTKDSNNNEVFKIVAK